MSEHPPHGAFDAYGIPVNDGPGHHDGRIGRDRRALRRFRHGGTAGAKKYQDRKAQAAGLPKGRRKIFHQNIRLVPQPGRGRVWR
jgi:hypothetical protein